MNNYFDNIRNYFDNTYNYFDNTHNYFDNTHVMIKNTFFVYGVFSFLKDIYYILKSNKMYNETPPQTIDKNETTKNSDYNSDSSTESLIIINDSDTESDTEISSVRKRRRRLSY